MYRNSTSRVRHRGLISEPLPIGQGTRQGGKSSPLLYLIYINGLIEKLEESVYNKKTEETSTFYLGHDRLPASDKYTHLGIECNSLLTTNNAIHDACVRLRGTYMSLCSKGSTNSLNDIQLIRYHKGPIWL
ncbi:hypothetical protein DPMN_020275 [Dreissena polymorpha]|uniref:Reverse transcriptase domain-containing protein n=1 Tax=Dreissena polymorpha TaxID=45954 RepID=A0A9D4SAW7_DREPO|nr:hypothetical protein DPMN_020275 [Dreissena polymorpha]